MFKRIINRYIKSYLDNVYTDQVGGSNILRSIAREEAGYVNRHGIAETPVYICEVCGCVVDKDHVQFGPSVIRTRRRFVHTFGDPNYKEAEYIHKPTYCRVHRPGAFQYVMI